MQNNKSYYQVLLLFILLNLTSLSFGATGSVTITSPPNGFVANSSFSISGTARMEEPEPNVNLGPCQNGGQRIIEQAMPAGTCGFYYGHIKYSIDNGPAVNVRAFESCSSSDLGKDISFSISINISGIDPNTSHAVKVFVQDVDRKICYEFSGLTSGLEYIYSEVAFDSISFNICSGQPELCDGVDNNCNGQIDEGCECLPGQTQACYDGPSGTAGVGLCMTGLKTCDGGHWGACSGQVLPQPEICDSQDNNCDGQVDQGLDINVDGDDYNSLNSCTNALDCNDNDSTIYPGATEICDGKDNDCDGMTDSCLCVDADGDGVNACLDCDDHDAQNIRVIGPDSDNDGFAQCADCNNSDPTIYPGAVELCDQKDNNCNGQTDENDVCCDDHDGDGYKNILCASGTDCNDDDVEMYPGNAEKCDGKDNNCNGQVDEGTGPCCKDPICCGEPDCKCEN